MRGWLLAGAILAALAAAMLFARRWITEAPSPDGTFVELAVAPGESFGAVARQLEEKGLVVSARRIRWIARLTGMDRQVRAGTYRLEHGARPMRLLGDLVEGRVLLRRVTVPEGWRLDQIAIAVRDSLGIPPEEFRVAAADPDRMEHAGARGANLEGYLFPDTYLFPDGVSAGEVVDTMVARFDEVWGELPGSLPAGMDRHDAVTLASIVEAETPLEPEMPRVAAVYLNRLREGWLLQADPTVRYGLEYWGERLYYKHLEVDTPYNTYRRAGLPPGPVGSPGRAAIAAVRAPLEPCEDFYFVASGHGGHVFSRTKEEHDRARRAAREAGESGPGPG